MIQQNTTVTARVFLNANPLGPTISRAFSKTGDNQFLAHFYLDTTTGHWQYRGGEAILALPVEGEKFAGFTGTPGQSGALRAIYIPATAQSLNDNADLAGAAAQNPFIGQRCLQTIEVSPDNNFYQVLDGVLFDKSGTTLIAYPPARAATRYTIPAEVRWIAAGAFAWADNLTEVIVPDTELSFGEGAFREMHNLQQIELPTTLTTLSPFLFQGCNSLTQLILPPTLNAIGRHALRDCSSLTELDLPPFLEQIGSSAFRGCSSLSELSIPPGIKTLAVSAFFECKENLRVIFEGNIDYGTLLYGHADAIDPVTGEYLLRPLTIAFWEWDNWLGRFMSALYGDEEPAEILQDIITFEFLGAYSYEPPSLRFQFTEESPTADSAGGIQISSWANAGSPTASIYYTLDGSAPNPDNGTEAHASQNGSFYSGWIYNIPLPLVLRARCFDSINNQPLSYEQWLRVSWSDTPVSLTHTYWDSWDHALAITQFANCQVQIASSDFSYFHDLFIPAEEAILTLPEYWKYFDHSDLSSNSGKEFSIDIDFGLCNARGQTPQPVPVVLSREFCQLPLSWNDDADNALNPNFDLWWTNLYTLEFRLAAPEDSGPYRVDNGVLFHQDKLLYYPGAKRGNNYIIPAGREVIGKYSFSGNIFDSWVYESDWIEDELTGEWLYVTEPPPLDWVDYTLRSVTVPGSVTLVEDWAFADCWHLQTVRFLGPPPNFARTEIFPTPSEWWRKPVTCIVQAFPGCGWEDLRRRWQNRMQDLRGDKTEEEWEDYCSWEDDWTFYGAVDLLIEGFMPPAITLNQDGTASISCYDRQGQEALPGSIVIYYTTDGTPPNVESPQYNTLFEVPAECQSILAVAYYQDDSRQASATGTVNIPFAEPQLGDPDAPWQLGQLTTPAGGTAWQTPANDALENRHIETFTGAGRLSFCWKMDSSAGVYKLLHNGKSVLTRQSYLPWEFIELSVTGSGIHIFTWAFKPSPADAIPSPNKAWLGEAIWCPAADSGPRYRKLTVYNGAINGQYQVGQPVAVLADILETATFSRWNIIAGLEGNLVDSTFVMPDNDVILRAVYRLSHSYTLNPGWNLLASNWLTLAGEELNDKLIYVYDQKKLTFVRRRLAELTGIQSFWIFNAAATAQQLELSGEISDQIVSSEPSWTMQAGSAIQEDAESIYLFDAEKQQYQKLLDDEEQDPWLGYWQYIPRN